MSNGSIHRPQEAFDLPLEPCSATRGSDPIDVQGKAHLFQARGVELETAVHHEVMHYAISRPFVHDAGIVSLEIDLRQKAVFQTGCDGLIARRIESDIYAQNAPRVAVDAGRDRWPSQRQASLVVYNHEVEQSVVYFRPFKRRLRDEMTLHAAEFFDCGIMSIACRMLVKRGNTRDHPGDQTPRRYRQRIAGRTQFVLLLHPAQCIFKCLLDAVACPAQILGRYGLFAELYNRQLGNGFTGCLLLRVSSTRARTSPFALRNLRFQR